MEADTHFAKGCLKCSALLFPKECFRTEKIPAKTLEGAVITGRILETRQEFVKVHLGIDRAQDADSGYEFPWTPATGNLLYCMPEKGTKAAVYFGSADEASGSVIYAVRENGLLCGYRPSEPVFYNRQPEKDAYGIGSDGAAQHDRERCGNFHRGRQRAGDSYSQ